MPSLAVSFVPGVVSSQKFEPFLDVPEAAKLLRIHPKTLQALARKGEVPCLRMGKYWRFRESSLDAWVQSKLIYDDQSRRVQ
jgi:excisionase family DNA binding protein